MLRIGVIGYGYWGPNIVRNFNALSDAKVVAVCDKNSAVLKKIANLYPSTRTVSDADEILTASDVDAVAIVTPVSTHYELTKKALLNGKHVFVEKPFTTSVAHAEELIELSEARQLVIMVDHTFLFTGAVRKMKELIDRGELGEIYYFDSTRVNLGLFQHDVNVIWDLAPHDFSIMNYLIAEKPMSVVACGQSHINKIENIAYVTVYFNSNMLAHFNVNWLSPVKVRNTLVGGEKKMLVWNDVAADEKLKVYDKGVEVKSQEGIRNLLVSYRSSDMYAPKIDPTEALTLECRHFVECISAKKQPINDGASGLAVVRMLAACDRSMKQREKMIRI